jgi:hypothetical protein
MHIYLWQQFSSNHSSSLVLVGRFASAAQAEDAANLMSNLLSQIEAWYSEHATEWDQIANETGTTPLTAPELKFRAAHNVHFGENSLSYWGFSSFMASKQQVRQLDEYVMMIPNHEANMDDPTPLANLITALGGVEAYLQLDSGAPIWDIEITLSCDAPGQEAAQEVLEMTTRYLEQSSPLHPTPWGWGRDRINCVRGRVTLDDSRLIFDFVSDDPYISLIALRDYLIAQGFTNITYSMRQVDMWEASE